MADAVYAVEVAWSTALTGVFTIGTSTLGGTDVLGGSFGGETYSDITDDVLQISITRGRTDDQQLMLAGQCSILLEDYSGKYSPANASSPLYPNVRPMRPIRVTATYGGTTYERFRGFIQSINAAPHLSRRAATIQAVDLFAWLQLTKPTIAATGSTTTGAAIGLVLDSIGYTSSSLRDLDVGDTIADFSADGSTSALDLIKNLLTAERGMFYMSGGGVATYESRHAGSLAPRDVDQSTVDGTMENLEAQIDASLVFNVATVTKTGGTAQTVSDAASIVDYGERAFPPVDTPYLASDLAAAGLASHVVTTYRTPRPTIDVEIMGDAEDALLAAALARDLGDRVGIAETWGNTSGSYWIQHIVERIGGRGALHTVGWQLREATTDAPFIIGQSTIGGTDVLVY